MEPSGRLEERQSSQPEPKVWRDPLAGPAPDELAASLEALRRRIVNRRRVRLFGRPAPSGDLFADADPDRVLVTCDAPDGVMRPCGCGSTLFVVEAGAGPHAAQLRCDFCGRGGRWLGREVFDSIDEAGP
jgi:hypothetical protein